MDLGRDPELIKALRLAISDARRSVSPAIIEARFFQKWDEIQAKNSISPAEQHRRENEHGLRVMAAMGNARGSASKAAELVSPNDPSSHYRLSQRFLRIIRDRNKIAQRAIGGDSLA